VVRRGDLSETGVGAVLYKGESFVQAVEQGGWTPQRQRAFLKHYGRLLRQALLSELGCRFGSGALRGLSDYLRALEQGRSPPAGGVAGQLLELACDTWQAICLEIFKAEGNTIMQYARYREKCAGEGRTPMPFESFLWNLVRLKLRQQLPRHRELFVPQVIPPEDEEGPWEEDVAIEGAPEVALADEVDLYWEGLLRCGEVDPQELERRLRLRERKEHLLCWACCALKRKLPLRQRENLLAFIAFFISQRGPERPREPLPQREELSLEKLVGRYLRWEEDVCRIFRKSMRKDRVLAQIPEELLRSPYRDLVGGEA
jgi:hypothetical protein